MKNFPRAFQCYNKLLREYYKSTQCCIILCVKEMAIILYILYVEVQYDTPVGVVKGGKYATNVPDYFASYFQSIL